ncbi:MAG: InlB B-repeat-containing protein [Firmicutes bacterium]|nr:InlB B-repeat-containing protein [Bacillota bacterium]
MKKILLGAVVLMITAVPIFFLTACGGENRVTYTVTFDTQVEGVTVHPRTAFEGSTIGAPPNPARDGYNFTGWFLHPIDGDTPFVFTTPITANITLFARWEEIVLDPFQTPQNLHVTRVNGAGNDSVTFPTYIRWSSPLYNNVLPSQWRVSVFLNDVPRGEPMVISGVGNQGPMSMSMGEMELGVGMNRIEVVAVATGFADSLPAVLEIDSTRLNTPKAGIEVKNGSPYLVWNSILGDIQNSTGVNQYRLERHNGASWVFVRSIEPTTTEYRINLHMANIPYGPEAKFRVRAVGEFPAVLNSEWSEVVPFTFTVPTAPRNVVAIPRDRGVGFTWDAPINTGGIDLNFFQISLDGVAWSNILPGATFWGAYFGSLINGVEYEFQIRARNGLGYSPVVLIKAAPSA